MSTDIENAPLWERLRYVQRVLEGQSPPEEDRMRALGIVRGLRIAAGRGMSEDPPAEVSEAAILDSPLNVTRETLPMLREMDSAVMDACRSAAVEALAPYSSAAVDLYNRFRRVIRGSVAHRTMDQLEAEQIVWDWIRTVGPENGADRVESKDTDSSQGRLVIAIRQGRPVCYGFVFRDEMNYSIAVCGTVDWRTQ